MSTTVAEWSEKWMMKFNSDKCKVLQIGRNNPKYEYTIKDGSEHVPLGSTYCEKDLGVHVDSMLNFNHHMSEIIKKARGVSAMLLRTFTYKKSDVMVPLFKSLVRPHLEYSNAVWCPYLLKDIQRIEKVQRHFTKRIEGMDGLTYEQRLQKLNLPSLEYRRLRGDLIEVFKITHNIYDPISTKDL